MTVSTTPFTSSNSSAQITAASSASAEPRVEPSPSNSLLVSPSNKAKPSTTGPAIVNTAAGHSVSLPNQATALSMPSNKSQPQPNTTPLIPGYPFGYSVLMSK